MSVTDTQLQALVHLACSMQHRARGDRRWDEAGVAAEIRKLNDQGLSADEIHDRTMSHARNPKCRTPAALRWPADRPQSAAAADLVADRSGEECLDHPGKPAVSCTLCAADRIARREEPPSYDETTGHQLKHRPLGELYRESLAELTPVAPSTDTTQESHP